jgi:hypothetical protein
MKKGERERTERERDEKPGKERELENKRLLETLGT